MLVLSRKQDQTIHIGNGIVIHVCQVKGNTVRIGIEAPDNVRVLRGELDVWGGQLPTLTKPSFNSGGPTVNQQLPLE